MMGQTKEGLKSADEAQMIFLETGDEKYEAMSLMLQANLLLHSQDFNEARMKAEESIYVLQKSRRQAAAMRPSWSSSTLALSWRWGPSRRRSLRSPRASSATTMILRPTCP